MFDLSGIKKKIGNRKQGILTENATINAAVILPLIENENGELSILFEVRAHHLKRQPSEICFPGGRIDKDDASPEDAAIRELTEELGVNKDQVELIAPLDVLVTPFRGFIYPFVARLKNAEQIQVNKEEVDHVFTVPLSFFLNYEPEMYKMGIHFEPDESFPLQKIANGTSYEKRTTYVSEYFYYYDDYVIWGITARILTHFLRLVRHQ